MRSLALSLSLVALPLTAQDISIPGKFHTGNPKQGRYAASEVLLPSWSAGLEAMNPYSLPALRPDTAGLPKLFGRPVVGESRDLEKGSMERGEWRMLDDGRWLWRWSVRSDGAKGLRLHFTDFQVGEGTVWVGKGTSAAQEFAGRGVHGDGEFWSATVAGDTAELEFIDARGQRMETLPFVVDQVAHRWSELDAPPVAAVPQMFAGGVQPEAASHAASSLGLSPGREIAACHLDVSCYADWRAHANGVARILFNTGRFLAVCSGALLNTRSGVGTPIFLTADHCISDEAMARTVEATFYYQTGSCGAQDPGARVGESILGATLLVRDEIRKGDYSLIQLKSAPQNAYFFGWSTAEPALGAKFTAIHHPAGTHKRISFGVRVEDQSFGLSGDRDALQLIPSEFYYQVRKTEGRVQGGSSGSPLINENRQIVGTLTSGPVYSEDEEENDVLTCQREPFVVQYGRLSKAFVGLKFFLEDLRSARLTFPSSGDTLRDGVIRFFWSPGVGASEYVLSIGTTFGGSELFRRSAGTSLSLEVPELPTDGRVLYVRLSTLLQGNWEHIDYTIRASSGPPPRPATLLSPANTSKLGSVSIEFTWDQGIGVNEYRLDVGTVAGGTDVARIDTGNVTKATVSGLPLDGRAVFVRLWSLMGNHWQFRDYGFRAVDQRVKILSLRVTNRLVYPVTISVNGVSAFTVPASEAVERELPGAETAAVTWQMIRPMLPRTAIPLGEALSGSFAPVEVTGPVTLEISNVAGGQAYFAPVLSNIGTSTYLVDVNGTRCNCSLSPGASGMQIGYYRWNGSNSIRGFGGLLGYSGASTAWAVTADQVETGSGAVRLSLR